MNTTSLLAAVRDTLSLALIMLIGAIVGAMFLLPFTSLGEPGAAAIRVIVAAVTGAFLAALGFKINSAPRSETQN